MEFINKEDFLRKAKRNLEVQFQDRKTKDIAYAILEQSTRDADSVEYGDAEWSVIAGDNAYLEAECSRCGFKVAIYDIMDGDVYGVDFSKIYPFCTCGAKMGYPGIPPGVLENHEDEEVEFILFQLYEGEEEDEEDGFSVSD